MVVLRNLGLLGCHLISRVKPFNSIVRYYHVILLNQVGWVGVLADRLILTVGLLLNTRVLHMLAVSFAGDISSILQALSVILVLDIQVL